jgi:dihydrofolate reductase
LVIATDLDGVIGKDGRLPWRLPEDLRHFRRLTLGKPVIMGRRTYESIGNPLDGRTNIVLTRRRDFHPEGVLVAASTDAALAVAARALMAHAPDSPSAEWEAQVDAEPLAGEVMVIGGAAVFAAFLPRAARVYWTLVEAHVDGNVRFPIDPRDWREVERTDHPADERHGHAFSFRTLERDRPA